MRYRSSDSQQGFSLIEVMICVALSLVVLGSIFQMLESNRATFTSGTTRMNVQQNARVGMDEMSRQLRMTGYFPENFDADTTNNRVNPIRIATHNALAIFGDADGSGTSNVFFFCLDGSVLRRGKAPNFDLDASYTCNAGDVLAEDVTSLRFGYYNASNVAVPNPATASFQLDNEGPGVAPPFSTVTQRQSVRRVVITLTVRQDVPRQSPQIYTLTSDVRLRNLN